jgi:hypothetical protein
VTKERATKDVLNGMLKSNDVARMQSTLIGKNNNILAARSWRIASVIGNHFYRMKNSYESKIMPTTSACSNCVSVSSMPLKRLSRIEMTRSANTRKKMKPVQPREAEEIDLAISQQSMR